MSKHRIIDAHHHLWDLTHCRYPWLMAKGVKRFFGDPTPIQKNYLPPDLLDDATKWDLAGSVHIQVGVDDGDIVKETEWLQSLDKFPTGVVGFADLTKSDFAKTLELHMAHRKFRGIRQIIGRHPSEDGKTGTDALLENPAFKSGLSILSEHGLSFDLQLIEPQYERATNLLDEFPDLKVVICHFASPWNQSAAGFSAWTSAIEKFALRPNTYFKLSGFGMFQPDWTTENIRPYVETALEKFGASRVMAGTNFPVDKLYGGYDRIWDSLETISPSNEIFKQITFDTANSFYRLDLQ